MWLMKLWQHFLCKHSDPIITGTSLRVLLLWWRWIYFASTYCLPHHTQPTHQPVRHVRPSASIKTHSYRLYINKNIYIILTHIWWRIHCVSFGLARTRRGVYKREYMNAHPTSQVSHKDVEVYTKSMAMTDSSEGVWTSLQSCTTILNLVSLIVLWINWNLWELCRTGQVKTHTHYTSLIHTDSSRSVSRLSPATFERVAIAIQEKLAQHPTHFVLYLRL